MAKDDELIHTFTAVVTDELGRTWHARAYGRPTANIWVGWIVFTDDAGESVETDMETSQPDRDALVYWSTGVEPIYLEGALARARGLPV
jgi:hypothetical protein